jgi:tetratricopeptide (TPR) repeat protein
MKTKSSLLVILAASLLVANGANVFAQTAQEHIDEGQSHHQQALDFEATGDLEGAAEHHHEAAIHFDEAAMIYESEGDYENAAKYHHEAAEHHHKAAIHLDSLEKFAEAAEHHKMASDHHKLAAMQFQELGDIDNYKIHLVQSLLHKGIAKSGSDYVLPPILQALLVQNVPEITCQEGFDLLIKTSNANPICVSSSTADHLVKRGFASYQ